MGKEAMFPFRSILFALVAGAAIACVGQTDEEIFDDTAAFGASPQCAEAGRSLFEKTERAKSSVQKFNTRYGKELVRALDRKQVFVRPFCAVTRAHFEEFVKYVDYSKVKGDPFQALRNGNKDAVATTQNALMGFQWDNVAYMSLEMNEDEYLDTLAHEVKHVLREAEKHYGTAKDVCIEEFEAYKASKLVKKEELSQTAIRELYEYTHAIIQGTENIVPEGTRFRAMSCEVLSMPKPGGADAGSEAGFGDAASSTAQTKEK